MTDLTGKRALVTGDGMGIGQGIAVELARRGPTSPSTKPTPNRTLQKGRGSWCRDTPARS